jgi:CRISPR-associated protein Cas1
MSDRILEIAHPARLSIRDAQLVIEREEFLPFVTPVRGVNTLLLAHPQVTLTQAVVSQLAEAGAMLVTIDHRYLPVAMTLPLQAHNLQTERLADQTALKPVTRKRLWRQIVQAKIRAQGSLLKELHGSDGGLIATATRVRSGDPENLEAQAARRYWGLIFAEPGEGKPRFRRGADPLESGPDQNRHLDYGYTVLRASVARALCAAGLHPSIGLRHHNRYDPFCLAADLMEPFRPLIDRRVASWIARNSPSGPLDSLAKRWLIEGVTMRYWVNREE